MRFFKNVLSQLHTYVLWALLSAVFWGWIFTAFVADSLSGVSSYMKEDSSSSCRYLSGE